MGRHKEFDIEEVLEKAALIFWEKGYANTSLRDLFRNTGIKSGSLYATFGSKENLFLKSLEYYNCSMTSRRIAPFDEEQNVAVALRKFFKFLYRDLKAKDRPKGCLFSNSLSGEILEKKIFRKYIETLIGSFLAGLTQKIQMNIKAKLIETPHSAEELSSLILIHIHGVLRISALSSISLRKMEKSTEVFLSALGF